AKQFVGHRLGKQPARGTFENDVDAGHALKTVLLFEMDFETSFAAARVHMIKGQYLTASRRHIHQSGIAPCRGALDVEPTAVPNPDMAFRRWSCDIDYISQSNACSIGIGYS